MRVWIFSDLHLDFGPVHLPTVQADVVVIAGDVDLGHAALDWVMETFPATPVVCVLGNHEYYHATFPALLHEFQGRSRGTNIHVLENALVEIDGVVFLGCTLWTDFELYGHAARPMRLAAERMNDFKLIRYLAIQAILTLCCAASATAIVENLG